MRITQKTSINKKLVIIICSVLLAGAVGIASFALINSSNENARLTEEIDNTSAVQEEQVTGEGAESDAESNLPDKSNGSPNDFQPDPNVETPQGAPEKPNLIRADNGSTIKIVATLQNSSLGYCELEMRNGASIFSRNADIIVGPSYYTCSFSFASSELSSGTWATTVTHKVGNAFTQSDSKNIEVN